jgi:RNA polymerase sigma-70 factor (ECF subfamily)
MQGGNTRATAALFDRYGSYVERLVARLLGIDPALYDLVQEIFVRAIRDIRNLKQPDSLKPWLRAITVNTVRTELKRRSRWSFLGFRDPDNVPDIEGASPDHDGIEALQRVRNILVQMPVDERMVLSLRFFAGMEQLHIADELGISLATVKRRLVKATERFTTLARRDPILKDRVQNGRWGMK